MTFTEKIEVLHVCHENDLDVTFQPNGMISIYKWNLMIRKIEWSIIHLPNEKVDDLFKKLYNKTQSTK